MTRGQRLHPALAVVVHSTVQVLAELEKRKFFGLHPNLFAGLWIAAIITGIILDFEGAEVTYLNAVRARESIGHDFECAVDCNFSGLQRDAFCLCERLYEFGFCHSP